MDKLFRDYIKRAEIRIKALQFYLESGGFAEVVRESQEVVELLLKGLLRFKGVEVPKMHDVSRALEEHIEYFPNLIATNLKKIKHISKRLRKERELSFYGADDFIPSEEYTKEDAIEAIKDATFIHDIIQKAIDQQK